MAGREGDFLLHSQPAPVLGAGRAGCCGLWAGFGSGRGKLAVLEVGLEVEADGEVAVHRRRAAGGISVQQLGLQALLAPSSAGSWGCWQCFGAQSHPG